MSGAEKPMTRISWTNLLFIATAHLMGLAAIAWVAWVYTSPWTIGLGLLWFALCGLAITGGYHRLFAHPTYRASRIVRAFYLLFGAASVQNSALKWAADHRMHHARTDREQDPYNIRRGFWWAHIGWVFFRDPEHGPARNVKDLQADPLLRWQDRHYVLLAIVVAGVVPLVLGSVWGDALGALLVAGFLRLVLQWHATFAVNSVAHWIGRQPYSRKNSARDSFWTALVTLGEGYHNFHHRFQSDYRNGVRWYHFDPTKWFVWSLEKLGLTWDLQRTPAPAILEARAAVLAEARAQATRSGARGLSR
jgi:stearoyl-CoA desaturase (delta-9 desaturase)